MNPVFIRGAGAVSPAGWGLTALRQTLQERKAVPANEVSQPNWPHPLRVRNVPRPAARPAFITHPRLRRSSPIAQYAVGAALEALGNDAQNAAAGSFRLGIIFCAMAGCVTYSRRFYDEILKDPATASPLLFPETVFNAPASHLAALLGTRAINYTLVGDPGTFLQGIALAADWLLTDTVDRCLVVGAEELDWLVAEAFHLFDKDTIVGEGAGALYLASEPNGGIPIELKAVTTPRLLSSRQSRAETAKATRAELDLGEETDCLLCDGLQGINRWDADESAAWENWRGGRLSVKTICGEGLMAAAAWQCVTAVDSLNQQKYSGAAVSIVGTNQQAIAAQFGKRIAI
ncbi:MAG TPA: hypothetical protein VL361_14330 [Candidatus Limnocylindrales bacterium]|nr:hypothetical protein [Candidatus Limnocylindrales bacterium]